MLTNLSSWIFQGAAQDPSSLSLYSLSYGVFQALISTSCSPLMLPGPQCPHREELLPNIQSKPTLWQFKAIPQCPRE